METANGQPPPPPDPAGPPPLVPIPACQAPGAADEERNMAMLCHLLAIFTGFIGPLVIWLVKKDQSAFIDHHGRESLNFQITILLLMLALFGMTFVLLFFIVGILLVPVLVAVPLVAMILEILAALAAQRGEWHRYAFNIRLV